MLRPIAFTLFILVSLVFQENPSLQVASPTRTPLGYPNVRITSPKSGQAVQGIIAIQGNSAIKNFVSAEIEFAYSYNPTNTWFPIQASQEAVKDNLLAEWDTTTITDGVYTLRLKVGTMDGHEYQVTISGLRVRNYTPIETDTPGAPGMDRATLATSTVSPTPTPLQPTPTLLPTNPAEFSVSEIGQSLGRGAIAVLAFFILLGLYLGFRRLFQRRA